MKAEWLLTVLIIFSNFQPESKNEKSPLQLLAQTCSQIGVDNGPSKILSSNNSEKLKSNEERSKKLVEGTGSSSEGDKVSFKPYRSSDSSDRPHNGCSVSPKSSSSSSPVLLSSTLSDLKAKDKPAISDATTKSNSSQKSSSSPSPIIQSGLDLLTSKPKLSTIPSSSSSMDPVTNPAFRPGLDAAGLMSAGSSAAAAAHAADYNAYLARLTLGAGGLPPGYMEMLESYKMYSAAAAAAGMRLPGLPPAAPPMTAAESQLAAYNQLLGAASLRGPYPSAMSSLSSSRYSPYPKPNYPPALSPLPPSIGGAGGVPGVPPLPPQLPPHLSSLSSLGAMNATNQMALYSLLGGRLWNISLAKLLTMHPALNYHVQPLACENYQVLMYIICA